MSPHSVDSSQAVRFELRFQPLSNTGRAYVFPCDAQGHVNMDDLSNNARTNYFYARTVVGRDLSYPAVIAQPAH